MNRGAGRRDIYHSEQDYYMFLELLSDTFSISKDRLLSSRKGKGVRNRPRKVAMYLCLHQAGFWLKDIVKAFNLAHYGGVSLAVGAFKKDIAEDLIFYKQVNSIINRLAP